MALQPGTRLGPFEITAQIGIGGMGEVYSARDTNLKRSVAIKVLSDAVAGDVERLARFQREAELLASLNHPNIAAIYGLERSGPTTALVLELVEGPTLAARIVRGPLPLDEALLIAKQIADALEAAHAQGIVHRDLKPANIKVRADGMVKVLDFGLAKALSSEAPSGVALDLANSPTVMSGAMTRLRHGSGAASTQMGVILGTAAYMSPEQARGHDADTRSDIWAFGAVLYEMLTGRSAFAGETLSDTIARTLEREPDWRALPASTPAKVRELLRRCLQKDRQGRLQAIADARGAIEQARTAQSGWRRVVGLPVVAGGLTLALAVIGGAWWYHWRSVPAGPHVPVSVLIADFENQTGDPTFDRTLEPVLRMVLEGASFISAYDRSRVNGSLSVRPPETLDERAAREIAAKQGLGVVLSGTLARQDARFLVSIKATEAVTGNVIAQVERTASSRDEVLSAATNLATTVRQALGDNASESLQRFAMETLSATSLEAIHDYAVGQEATSDGRSDDARRAYSRAVERDPKFGLAWAGLAIQSRNLSKEEEAKKYIEEALRHLDGMTERERFRTRGIYFLILGDSAQGVKEYEDLIARYPEDAAAHNNLALLLAARQDWPRALDEIRQAVRILPKRTLYRANLALYASYAGDFQTGEREARSMSEPGVFGLLALAFAQLGQGQLPEATETYRALAKFSTQGASYAASGLGDMALYDGRYSEAEQILTRGAHADVTSKDTGRAAHKFALLAYTQLLRQQPRLAIAAAGNALDNSQTDGIRFAAARVFVEAGEIGRAEKLAAELAGKGDKDGKALATIIEAEIVLKRGNAVRAITLLRDANGLRDSWLGHFDLGRAYLEAGQFPQADSEFDRCSGRRGDVLHLFHADIPTYGYLPPVYYYQGRVREELKTEGFAESYRTYLKTREKAGEDPLLPEVRRRAGL